MYWVAVVANNCQIPIGCTTLQIRFEWEQSGLGTHGQEVGGDCKKCQLTKSCLRPREGASSRLQEWPRGTCLPCLLVPDLPIEANLLCSASRRLFLHCSQGASSTLLLLFSSCCSSFYSAAICVSLYLAVSAALQTVKSDRSSNRKQHHCKVQSVSL